MRSRKQRTLQYLLGCFNTRSVDSVKDYEALLNLLARLLTITEACEDMADTT